MKRLIGLFCVVAAAAGLWFWVIAPLRAPKPHAAADAPVLVAVAQVQKEDVPIYLSGIGYVQAFNSVAVKSRVDGQLQSLDFREGEDVKPSQILARIDPRPYQATVKQNEAALKKDQAQLLNARLDLDRYQSLIGRGFTSRQSLDTQKALVQQYEAQAASDQALLDYARTQLDYCTILAPIAGRTGIRQVDPGNIVHAADTTPIVVVTQIHPISVVFTLPAEQLNAIAAAKAAGPLVVMAAGKDDQQMLSQGQLELFDNQIDQTTSTIKLKATFQNQDTKLWPGQFVNVRLLVETRRQGLVIPANAVQLGPKGSYVWIAHPDGTADMQPIDIRQTAGGKTLINGGLEAGQTIIVDGAYLLQQGSKIEIQRRVPDSTAEIIPTAGTGKPVQADSHGAAGPG